MIVKMGIDLARGFGPWKEMFVKNEHKLNAHGGRLVFAGTEKDNVLFFEFLPKGLTSSNNKTSSLLRQGIPGYQDKVKYE